jgi:hypothetical protein
MLSFTRGAIYAASLVRSTPWSGVRHSVSGTTNDQLISRRIIQLETISLLFIGFLIDVGALRRAFSTDRLVSAYEADGL